MKKKKKEMTTHKQRGNNGEGWRRGSRGLTTTSATEKMIWNLEPELERHRLRPRSTDLESISSNLRDCITDLGPRNYWWLEIDLGGDMWLAIGVGGG